jgi:hypothetical protein
MTVYSFGDCFKILIGYMRRNKSPLQVVVECILSCFDDTVLNISLQIVRRLICRID